jgi:hypothetical protein
MLPAAAGIPPHVAQVPIAIVAAAPGASATIQSLTRARCPARARDLPLGQSSGPPIAAKCPSSSARSSGTEPSSTRMYGAPSEPSAADA